jgi:hypothetical protein
MKVEASAVIELPRLHRAGGRKKTVAKIGCCTRLDADADEG